MPPHRDGGQAQFIARAVPDCDAETLGPLLTWITENLADDLGVEDLARRSAHVAAHVRAPVPRRDRHHPARVDHRQRVQAAEELLETTDRPVDWITAEVGFGNPAALRHHFTRVRGVRPQQCRRTFAGARSA